MAEIKTLTVTNLGGGLTRKTDGDINSGNAKYNSSWGYDPYTKPGNLTWMEQPSSILTTSVIGVVTVMKQRTEGSDSYVYGVSEDSKLYKIKVSDTNTSNPNLDSPSILGSLAVGANANSGVGMVFYGSTEKIFYGDTASVQKINFDGSGGASILGQSSVMTAISGFPRPMIQFLGKVYFGNGNNIGEIDSTEIITTGTKLSPGLPSGTIVRDLDITPDGNYLQIIAGRNSVLGGFINFARTNAAVADSYKFLWNGTDNGYTASESYPSIGITSNTAFGDKNFLLGYDQAGTALFSGSDKILSLPKLDSPPPTAVLTNSNMLGFMTSEYEPSSGSQKGSLFNYGQYDNETPKGLFRMLKQSSVDRKDINFIPAVTNVANLFYGPSYLNYPNNIVGVGKIYYSTIESTTNNNQNVDRLWRFTTVPTGAGSILAGVYETQNQLFPKKVAVKEIRLYTEPLVVGNSFTLDVIGSGGSVMAGGSKTFTVGANVTAGDDIVAFNPAMSPTYSVGIRVTNSSVLGTVNWTATKLELDYTDAGK